MLICGLNSKRERTLKDWSVDELKDRMFKLANEDPHVLKSLEEIPRESYGNWGEYQAIFEEGKSRFVNFEFGHNYLCSILAGK